MTVRLAPICIGCTHYLKNAPGYACEAFAVIPEGILHNEVDHREPVEGDNGIRFAARDAWWGEEADRIFAVEAEA